jgi:hypothetical protein
MTSLDGGTRVPGQALPDVPCCVVFHVGNTGEADLDRITAPLFRPICLPLLGRDREVDYHSELFFVEESR